MAEPVLDQPRVVAGIGHGIAAGVAQHVGVDPKRQLGALANGFHEAINGVSRKWTAALGLKDGSTRRVPLQLAQHAQFVTADGMHRGLAVLGPADVQCWIAAPLDLRPLKVGDLDGPQAVPEGNQDQRSVSLAVAPQLRSRDQLLDLGRGQIFAGAHLGIRLSCRYFPINVVWLDQPRVRHHQHFPLHPDNNLPDNALSSESRCKCWVSQLAADHQSGSSAERRRHWRRAADDQAKRRSADLENAKPCLPTRCRAPAAPCRWRQVSLVSGVGSGGGERFLSDMTPQELQSRQFQ
jgi:hypothetical protein